MLAVAVIERYNPVFNSQHQKNKTKKKNPKKTKKPKNQKTKKQTKQFIRLHYMALTLEEEALERTRFSLLSKEVEVAEFQLGCSWERIRAHFRGEGVGTHSQKAEVG